MKKSAPVVKPEVVFIEDLLNEIAKGNLRVPNFQRPLTWRPEALLKLFDSIIKGFPIGGLLLWETGLQVQSRSEFGPLGIPDARDQPATYVLDGQQRLATLYGVLRLPKNWPRESGDEMSWQWWIYFDLREERFVHQRKGAPPPHFLPLRALSKTVDFLAETRRMIKALGDEADELIPRAEDLAQKVKSYRVAVNRIQGGDLEDAVEIFSRLNKLGQEMTADQMVSALTYREGSGAFDLADRIDDILESLSPSRFDGVRRESIFHCIVAASGTKIRDIEWEAQAKGIRNRPESVDEADESLQRAATFLSEELLVKADRLLPYSYQIVMLSEFFRLKPKPSRAQRALLRKWFWATSFSGWFAGASDTQINKGLDEMRAVAEGRKKTFTLMSLEDPAEPYPTSFDSRTARVRALILVEVANTPLDSEGEPVDAAALISEHGNRALAHVFPRMKGVSKRDPANRILMPRRRRKSVRKQLLELDTALRKDVLESHGIDERAYKALKRNDGEGFVRARSERLRAMEIEFLQERDILPPH